MEKQIEIIKKNIPLADKNWFQTGGSAAYFAEPSTIAEFQDALHYANSHNLGICLLGKGANILISDTGYDGLIIRPTLKEISHTEEGEKTLVKVGAGVSINNLIQYCLNNNIVGLEEFSGIPGSIGGSVYINVHYFRSSLGQFVEKATIINRETGKTKEVQKDWFNFGYDQSTLFDKKNYLVDATFTLKKVDDIQTAYAKGKRDEIIRYRTARYPTTRTCGCFFRNFTDKEVAHTDKKLRYVAYYLDKLGIKGELSVGDAIVSHQHANMIVNQENATSQNIIDLAKKMQKMVQDTFGLTPQTECQFIGFATNPLLK